MVRGGQRREAVLKEVQAASIKYVEEQNRLSPGSTHLLPFGLHCEPFIAGLVSSLRSSLPDYLLRSPPRRMWLVAGSATLLACFHRIWPTCKFLVVQVRTYASKPPTFCLYSFINWCPQCAGWEKDLAGPVQAHEGPAVSTMCFSCFQNPAPH